MSHPYQKLLVIVAMLWATPLSAQRHSPAKKVASKNHDKYPGTVLCIADAIAKNNRTYLAKTTGTGSRLVADVNITFDSGGLYAYADSSVYYYSGSHGGDYEKNLALFNEIQDQYALRYDSSMHYFYPGSLPYQVEDRGFQTIDVQNRVSSAMHQSLNDSASWINNSNTIIYYNATGKIDSQVNQVWDTTTNSWASTDTRQINNYDAANNLIFSSVEQWSILRSRYLYKTEDFYTYDNRNNLTSHYYQTFDTASYAWYPGIEIYYYYNANNAVTAEVISDPGSGSSLPIDSTAFLYNASNALISGTDYFWSVDSSEYIQDSYYAVTTNSGGKPTLIEGANYDISGNLVDSSRYIWTYNAFNQTTSRYYEEYDGSNWSTDGTDGENYYYENYTVGVDPVASNSSPIKLYPIPSNNTIAIAITFEQPQLVSACITDVTGKTMMKWTETTGSLNYTRQVSTAAFPAGTYYMQVVSDGSSVSKMFTVVH